MASKKELEAKAKSVADGYDKVIKEYNDQIIYKIADNNKDKQIYIDNYIWTYYDSIHEYFENYYNKDENTSKRLKRLFEAYESYKQSDNKHNISSNSISQDNQQGGQLSVSETLNQFASQMELKSEKEKEVPVNVEPGAWKNVNASYVSEIRKMCQWIYRHYNDTGIGGKTQMFFAQKYILNQPLPIKMVAFYMVENKLTSLQPTDIINIYVSYKPDYHRFKDSISQSKIHIFNKMMGKNIKWSRLENAMQVAIQSSEYINEIGRIENKEESNRAFIQDGEKGDLDISNNELDSVVDANINALTELFNALIAYKNLKEKAEVDERNGDIDDSTRQELQIKMNEIVSKVNNENINIDSFYNVIKSNAKSLGGKKSVKDIIMKQAPSIKKKSNNMSKIEPFARSMVAEANALAESGQLSPIGITKTIVKISKEYKKIADIVKTSIGGMSNIAGIISLYFNYINFFKSIKKKTAMQNTSDAMGILGETAVLAGSITSTVNGIMKSANLMQPKATTSLISSASSGVSVINVVAGGATAIGNSIVMGKGIFDVVKANKQSSIEKKAYNDIVSSSNDDRTKNIMKNVDLQYKNNNKKNNYNAYEKIISGGLKSAGGVLTMTGVGALIGSVLTGISLGVDLVSWIVDTKKSNKSYKEIIDNYIGMEKVYEDVKTNILSNSSDKTNAEKLITSNKDKIKRQIRYEVAAIEGCSNPTIFMEFILKKYASFIYNKIFYINGENKPQNLIHKEREDFDKLKEKGTDSYKYREFLKAYGIKVTYPKNISDTPAPSATAIAKKMK